MIDILYMGGMGRSGSTLLERLLGQFEGSVAVGELRYLWAEDPTIARCGCGRLLVECPFWGEVLERAGIAATGATFAEMLAVQQRVDRLRYIPHMMVRPLAGRTYAQYYQTYSDALQRVYRAAYEVGGGRIIVDSSKDISMLYLLARMEEVHLRLMHLVRDSRAVAYSWTKTVVRPHTVDQVTYMDRYSPTRSAADWLYRNTLTEAARRYADGYLRLRYEDMIADPRTTLRRAAEFMGLPDADLSFVGADEIDLPREIHTVAGNPMKFKPGALRLRLDDAWQEALGASDRRIVTAATWPLLRRYGYSRDGHQRHEQRAELAAADRAQR